jgi:hypothetical protein
MTYPVFFVSVWINNRALFTKISSFPTQNMMDHGYFLKFNQSFFDQLTSILNTRLAACIQKTNLPDSNAKTCKL